jgi:ferrochelatase
MDSPEHKIEKIGVILANLGSPTEPSPKAVRSFLIPFLHDHRVIELTRWLWCPILYGIILPFRSVKSAKNYAKVWWPEGSPLRVITQRQVSALQSYMDETNPGRYVVTEAYSYSAPNLESALDKLGDQNAEQVVLLPLYPQYSATSTAPLLDQLGKYFQSRRNPLQVSYARSYFRNSHYIDALAQSVKQYWSEHGQADVLLMSFHGIPQLFADKGDPYPQECEATAQLLAQALGLQSHQWQISFQSRLGRAQWLTPSTSDSLALLGNKKLASVQVICPGFSVDCLETLEEIEMENAEIYQTAGGNGYQYIACLNDSSDHIQMMAELVKSHQVG